MDALAGGVSFTITFSSNGTWSSTVSGDTNGFFCDTGTACTDGGTYTSTASTLTLDPGTIDETALNYTLSGNTVTLTGSIDGNAVSATFTKI